MDNVKGPLLTFYCLVDSIVVYNSSKVVPKLITFTSHKKRLKLNEATDRGASSSVFIEHGILHILNERKKGTVAAIVIIKKQPSNSSRQIQKTFF